MVLVVDILYLFFAAVTLYFLFFFLILYSRNKSFLKATPKLNNLLPVSIIVPAHNEEKTISGTLKALANLVYPKDKLEIIVVDDGSTDRTYETVKKFRNVKIIRKENSGKASALNLGIKKARNGIIACVDSDSRPMPDALMKSLPFFNEKLVAAVTTSIFVRQPKNFIERLQWLEYMMIVWSRKLLEYVDSVYVTPGPLSLYRKDVLLKVGGFDVNNMTEDIEVTWRLLSKGYKVRMATEARTYTTAPKKFSNWWNQRIRWNLGGIQTMMKYKYTFLKESYGMLGSFVWPFFSASYALSFIGLGLFTYLILNYFYNQFSFVSGAYAIGIDPLKHWQLWIVPDIFTIFGILVFVLSIMWVKISLNITREKYKPKNLIDYLLYLSFYITIFPINLVHSTWRYFTRKFKW